VGHGVRLGQIATVLSLLVASTLGASCKADGEVSGDATVEASGDAPGCWQLQEAPRWVVGTAGDVLCMQRERFVLLVADGTTWDGWPVRWTSRGGVRRATVTGTPGLDRIDVHWDVRAEPPGGLTLERPGGRKVRLGTLPDDWKRAAKDRLAKVGDVMADCKRVRRCYDHAPAAAREMIDPEMVYGARACALMARSLCTGNE